MSLLTSVIWKACARFPGSELRAVSPDPRDPGDPQDPRANARSIVLVRGEFADATPFFIQIDGFSRGLCFFCGILSGKTCFNLPSKKNVHRATSIIFSRPASHLGFLWRAETLRPISTRFAQPSPHLRSLFRFLTPRATSKIFAHSVPPRLSLAVFLDDF